MEQKQNIQKKDEMPKRAKVDFLTLLTIYQINLSDSILLEEERQQTVLYFVFQVYDYPDCVKKKKNLSKNFGFSNHQCIILKYFKESNNFLKNHGFACNLWGGGGGGWGRSKNYVQVHILTLFPSLWTIVFAASC